MSTSRKREYGIMIRGWHCRSCQAFNGEERVMLERCRSCDVARPDDEEILAGASPESANVALLRGMLYQAHARERAMALRLDTTLDALRQAVDLLREGTRSSLHRRTEAFLDQVKT